MLRRFYCRCCSQRGGLPSLLPAYPAFSLLCCPHPPSPLPLRGRGRLKVYFAGGFAPGTPALNRLRHLQSLPLLCPAGACLLCRLPTPPLASLSAPYPPAPLPRRGRGRPRFFHARGSAPCIPGAEPKRRWEQGRTTRPAGQRARLVAGSTCLCCARRGGACPLCRLLLPAFSLLSCPLSPRPPSPAGKGVTKSLFRRGLRPRHPCTESLAALARPANPAPAGDSFSASPVRCKTDRTAFLLAVPAAKERGDRGRGTSAFEMVLSPGAGIASAAGKIALRARAGGIGGRKAS